MKRIILLSNIIVLILTFTTQPAVAHILKTDGTIGAILHMFPDDNPKSGISTTYELAFKDTDDQFTLSNCDCSAEIQSNGKTIELQTLDTVYPLTSQNTYTFPEPNVYTLIVTGQPKKEKMFQSFTLYYDIRVEGSENNDSQAFPTTLTIGMSLVLELILLRAYASDRKEFNKKNRR